MKPYGQQPGETDTGEGRPCSASREFPPGNDTSVLLSQETVKTMRRRLKKKARRAGKEESKDSGDGLVP